jgi:hypothetical protein
VKNGHPLRADPYNGGRELNRFPIDPDSAMKDVIVIAIIVGFFAVCAAYVTWCDRMLAADAPDRVGNDASLVGRAASTAGAADNQFADNQFVGVSPGAAGTEGADARRQ